MGFPPPRGGSREDPLGSLSVSLRLWAPWEVTRQGVSDVRRLYEDPSKLCACGGLGGSSVQTFNVHWKEGLRMDSWGLWDVA